MEVESSNQTSQSDGVVTVSEKQYAMLIHLTQIIGIIIPLVLWLIKKDSSKFIDDNGKIVINWLWNYRWNSSSAFHRLYYFNCRRNLQSGIPDHWES